MAFGGSPFLDISSNIWTELKREIDQILQIARTLLDLIDHQIVQLAQEFIAYTCLHLPDDEDLITLND